MKGAALDFVSLVGLMGALFGVKALVQDHKNDEDEAVKNWFKFGLKVTDRLSDEVGFFYNPLSLEQTIAGGIFPSTSIITDGTKAISHSIDALFGSNTPTSKPQPIKYLMRNFPIVNRTLDWIPFFDPQLAKDWDIHVQTSSNVGGK